VVCFIQALFKSTSTGSKLKFVI